MAFRSAFDPSSVSFNLRQRAPCRRSRFDYDYLPMQNVSKGSSAFGAKRSRVRMLAGVGRVVALEASEETAAQAVKQ